MSKTHWVSNSCRAQRITNIKPCSKGNNQGALLRANTGQACNLRLPSERTHASHTRMKKWPAEGSKAVACLICWSGLVQSTTCARITSVKMIDSRPKCLKRWWIRTLRASVVTCRLVAGRRLVLTRRRKRHGKRSTLGDSATSRNVWMAFMRRNRTKLLRGKDLDLLFQEATQFFTPNSWGTQPKTAKSTPTSSPTSKSPPNKA